MHRSSHPKKMTQPSPMRKHQPMAKVRAPRTPALMPTQLAALASLPQDPTSLSQCRTRNMHLATVPNYDRESLKESPLIQMYALDRVEQSNQVDVYVLPTEPRLNRVLDYGAAPESTPLMPGGKYTGQPLAEGNSIAETNSVLMCINTFLQEHQDKKEYKSQPIFADLFEILRAEFEAIQLIEFLNIYELYEYTNVIIGKMVKSCVSPLPPLFLEFIIGLMAFTFDQIRFDERPEICDEWGYFLFFKLSQMDKQPNDAIVEKAQSPAIDFTPLFSSKDSLPELRKFYFINVFYEVAPTLTNTEQVAKDWSRLPVFGRRGDNTPWDKFPTEAYKPEAEKKDIKRVIQFLKKIIVPEKLAQPLACILTQTMLVNCFAIFRSLFERVNDGRYTLTNDEVGNMIFFEVDPASGCVKVIMTTFISTFTDLGPQGKHATRHAFTPAIPWVLSFELHDRGDHFDFKKPLCSMPVDFAFTNYKELQKLIFKTMKEAIPF